jgi:hypothetical protein
MGGIVGTLCACPPVLRENDIRDGAFVDEPAVDGRD